MSKQHNTTTGKKLRACRERCGLSQRQVAEALGLERTTYTYYESGRTEPNLTTLVKIAQIFCVDVSALLPDENGDTPLRDSDNSAPNPIYSLSKDEQNLLISFRLLSDKEKKRILAKITNMTKDEK